MNRTLRIPSVVAAVLVTFALAPTAVRAEDGVGSVRGKVVKSDGSRVANATVQLMERAAVRKRKVADAAAQPTAQPDAGAAKPKRPRPAATAEATTNAQGEFALTNVPAGRYVLTARLKGEGNGREPVTVQAGGSADVTVTLKAKGERKANPGAGAATDATRAERRKARLQRRHERAAQQRAAQ